MTLLGDQELGVAQPARAEAGEQAPPRDGVADVVLGAIEGQARPSGTAQAEISDMCDVAVEYAARLTADLPSGRTHRSEIIRRHR